MNTKKSKVKRDFAKMDREVKDFEARLWKGGVGMVGPQSLKHAVPAAKKL